MALTKKHFEWLAKEISPLVSNKELFIVKVKEISRNTNFNIYKFRDAVESAYIDNQSEQCGPDLYKLADYKEN